MPARVAKLADARDLKSRVLNRTYRFNSGPGHHLNLAHLLPGSLLFDPPVISLSESDLCQSLCFIKARTINSFTIAGTAAPQRLFGINRRFHSRSVIVSRASRDSVRVYGGTLRL